MNVYKVTSVLKDVVLVIASSIISVGIGVGIFYIVCRASGQIG